MSDLLTELSERAAALPPKERAQLAQILLLSLHDVVAADVEAAWDEELKTRLASYERGDATVTPAEDVFAEAHRLTQ
jgi:putative addiction module component (TIGR02574 family)